MNKKILKIPILFIILGSCLLLVSFINLNNYNFKDQSYVETDAMVVDHRYENSKPVSVVIEYTIDDITYRTTSNSKVDKLKSYGSIIKVKYDPYSPEKVILTSKKINIWYPSLAIAFIAIGEMILVLFLIKTRKSKKLSSIPITNEYTNTIITENNRDNDLRIIHTVTKPMSYDKPVINMNNSYPINDQNIEEAKPIRVYAPANNEKITPVVNEEVTNIPITSFVSNKQDDSANYKEYISNIEVDENEFISFIPNYEEVKERIQ